MNYNKATAKTQSPANSLFDDMSFSSRKTAPKKTTLAKKSAPKKQKSEVTTITANLAIVDSKSETCEKRALLGINTKSSSPCEIKGGVSAEKKSLVRRERYELGRIARAVYAREGEKQGLKYVLNYHRTAKCSYVNFGDVIVNKSVEHGSCHFKNLMFCGSVWTCPTCSAKIQERRRCEIAQAVDYAYENGKKCIMVTFTFPHGFNDELGELLKRQAKAFTALRSGKAFDNFKKDAGFLGMIRSLELTYGDNGFHPHTHELWIVNKTANAEKIKDFVLKRWLKICLKVGLLEDEKKKIEAFLKHAVDVKDNCKASQYLAKMDDSKHWGIDRELAKGSTKKGKKSGVHPFAFLTNFEQTRDHFWAEKWLEYSKAVHGKAQLFWSRGLKKLVGIDEKTDIELATESVEKSIEIIRLDSELWRKIIRRKNAQAVVLEVCEKTNDEMVILQTIEDYQPESNLIDIIEARYLIKEES